MYVFLKYIIQPKNNQHTLLKKIGNIIKTITIFDWIGLIKRK
jgi:hypothetical protein